jgi:glycosyltransferase involved in cell wall biosynthesis
MESRQSTCQRYFSAVIVPVMRILFLTRSISDGGAERQLALLARELARRGHQCTVVAFYRGNKDVDTGDVNSIILDKSGRWEVFGFAFRLIQTIRRLRPDVIHGYLSVPNILGILLRGFAPKSIVVFGIRASKIELRHYDRLSRWSYWIEARLARWADGIIVNSQAGRDATLKRGLPDARMAVIRNGIDTQAFQFDPEARRRFRKRWGFVDDDLVVGMVARWDPMKDHATFLRALSLAAPRAPKLRAILVGDGPVRHRDRLKSLAADLCQMPIIHWTGWEQDMAGVYSGLDLLCLSSAFGEGLPNVVAEAMACERPCIVSDIGDSSELLQGSGRIVPPASPEALADALVEMADQPECLRSSLGRAARRRIETCFTAGQLAEQTEAVLQLWRARLR